MKRTYAILLTVLIGLTTVACGPPPANQPAAEPAAAQWRQIWQDTFAGPAGTPPSAANWQHDTGTCYPGCPAPQWGTGEIETMTDSTRNVSLDGEGHLAITPLNTGGQWTSGRVETRRADFRPPPSGILRVEASLKLPDVTKVDGAGYWPAFWLLGEPIRTTGTGWPGAGEVDVMESVNGAGSVFATLHCGTLPQGPCDEPRGLGSSERPCQDCGEAFHTYAVEIDRSAQPQAIRWYLDGKKTFQVTADQVTPQAWQQATGHGFFFILNVAIGGGLPAAQGGVPRPGTVPGRPMLVDSVVVLVKS